MICPTCHGTGWPAMLPPIGCCETCGGTGFAHCCEGERPGNVVKPPSHPMWDNDYDNPEFP